MKILVVDDEKYSLNATLRAVEQAVPDAQIDAFQYSEMALKAAQGTKYDIAFSDIQMPEIGGIELAKGLKKTNPLINVIFVTGFDEYKDDAIRVHASGYLSKPVDREAVEQELENLLHPLEPEHFEAYAQTFGHFSFFVKNKPVHFKRDREKEILAYLIDRKGALISRKELAAVLFEDSDFPRSEQVYLTTIIHDLMEDLKAAGADGVVEKYHGSCRVNVDAFRCDSYDYLNNDVAAINRFTGEYMEQYSWAEYLKDKFYF